MEKISPILLAGGSGTRLWPLSRKSYPKQFSNLAGERTLFQESALRLRSSEAIALDSPTIVTNSDFRFIVGEQLSDIGIDPGSILIEPAAKNTAAAILAASIYLNSNNQDAILLVAPSDHVISDTYGFHKAIFAGLSHVKLGKIVTFGVRPTRPETGYGYLETSSDVLDNAGAVDLLRFVEKPVLADAEKMISAGNFLWNAGIFLFKASDMVSAFEVYAPDTLHLVQKAVDNATSDLGFLRLSAEPWSLVEDISIDYAIMEKAQNLVAVPYSSKWSDLGGWDAVWAEGNPDSAGNVASENAIAIDCVDSLVRSESTAQHIVGIGLNNILAISMPDAVLVAHKDRAQDVKIAVELLKSKHVPQAEIYPRDYRPWGWFESLAMGDCFQVKRISVNPGAALSLQSHEHRSEHWVVVEGTAKVTIEDDVRLVNAGQSVYVPLRAKHRMENPGKTVMILIEVQIGTYLGEDDITRYEDVYARG